MLTIWGRISSINVQKVVWAAGEVGQSFERIDCGGPFGGLREPMFLAKNPNAQIPVLEDGDVCIWESNSIVRYLAARYGAGWIWEEDPARRAEAERDLAAHLAKVNAQLDPHEQLDFVAIAKDQWTVENGFITPTLKVKRAAIESGYGKHFDAWLRQRQPVVWER